jgi:glycosyltransferase involved in cell wall biosynthesis
VSRTTALLLVRNTFVHDARVLRAARVLRDGGFEPKVLAVMSTLERRRTQVVDGIPVLRLEPDSPLGWLRRRLRPAPPTRPETMARGGTDSAGADAATRSYNVLLRLHRWSRTVDFYRRALGVVRRERPALLHCNDYNTMWIGVLSRFLGRPAVVYDTHELWPDRNLRPEPRGWLMACEWLFVRSADVIVASSPGHADIVSRRYRVAPPHVVRNIPQRCGVTPLAQPSEPDTAVYVGAVAPNRGIEQMLATLPLVDELRLRVMGPAREGYLPSLRRLAAELGVTDRLELVAPVGPDEVLRSVCGAAFGVALFQPTCLSHRLVAPNKVFEYLTAGLPSLVSDLPVIREFIRSHGVGCVVDPSEPSRIAEGARTLLDPATNRAMRAAVAIAVGTVTWENERRILERAYAQALEPRT